jgi:alpha-L-rhamnosidase
MGGKGGRRLGLVLLASLGLALALPAGAHGVALAAAPTVTAPEAPSALVVQSRSTPLGVDPHTVDFGWHVNDPRRGATQGTYEILVSRAPTTNPTDPSVVWASGTVPSTEQAFVPYAGPPLASDTTYFWTVRTSQHGFPGPFARPTRFDTGLTDGDWGATWIRRASAPAGAEEYTYTRKQVAVAASPVTRAVAYASAGQQYQLWINGVRADQGPSFSYPDRQYYQATDVTRLLRPGRANAVGLLDHWSGPGKGRPASAPGVILHLSVEHRDGTRETITTDASWRVHPAEWLKAPPRNDQSGDFVERIDARGAPTGWDRPGFDDRSWEPALAVGAHPTDPWTHLVAQTTRITETPVHPVSLTRLSSGSYVADFGRVNAAVPAVTFASGTPGHHVQLHVGYVLDPDGQASITFATQQTDLSYEYIQTRGRQTFHPFGYLGFRYLQIDHPGRTLSRGDVVAYARHSAVPDEHAATFSSGNPTLDAVWELGRHSALYGSQEEFLDTPTREKGPFLADSFNISSTAMRAFGARNLTQQALADFANSQARYWPDGRVNAIDPGGQGKRDIPDFTELYPEWVWRYYLDTGDRTRLEALYPVIVNVANYVARYVDPGTGLVTNLAGADDSPDYLHGLVDWPPANRYGYDMSTAARTTVNLLAVNVFERVRQAATELGDTATAAALQGRGSTLIAAINQRLTRPDGVYVDGLKADGSMSGHASQHANAYALAYGVVPPGRVPTVAAYVAGGGLAMGPMTALALLRSLHATGHDAELVRVLTDRRHPGWANIVARGGTFTWEAWILKETEGDSQSHGWGSTVLVGMQEALLGVTPLQPGFAEFAFAPPTGGIHAASGRVPTQRGPVDVSWRSGPHPGGPFRLRITVPANSAATVTIPTTNPTHVREGRRRAADAPGVELVRHDGTNAVYRLGSGTYDLTSSG